METRKMTAKKAKELLYDIETFVHIGGFETGYRVNLKRSKSLCHYAYNEYKDFCDDETKLAVMAEMDVCRVFKAEKRELYHVLRNDYTSYYIYFDDESKFYYGEINGNQFLIVSSLGYCNIFQLFRVSLPEIKQYTDSEIEQMYNELQTGREIHFETKTGICKASIIDPMIYSIIIEGQMKRTIPNNFELFCKYVKHGAI